MLATDAGNVPHPAQPLNSAIAQGEQRNAREDHPPVGAERHIEQLGGLLRGRRRLHVGVDQGALQFGVARTGNQRIDRLLNK